MMLDTASAQFGNLNGFGRTATDQALENLTQALRVLELAPCEVSHLCPHPLIIVRAEIENARRYLLGPGSVPVRRRLRLGTAIRVSGAQAMPAA